MILKRPNEEPCFFCGKKKARAMAMGAKQNLCVCRSCASEVLPELIAEASFLDIQDENLDPSSKRQNREMPREYSLKWDLLGLKYTQKLLELSHGYDEFILTENGPYTEEHINKMNDLQKQLSKKGKKKSA